MEQSVEGLIALDDFGSGYTCMATLAKLPLHQLKIDPQLISGIGFDESAEAMVFATCHQGQHKAN
ncbi:MAG: EAL domain-containing protein (putative c-di-GMP-specific phosphodiesterase class I) [Alteromonadaceae bacterium]|jgi:EAL domain-containing protein (putative c-di-GMP-specific phosphodiesterase class I)